MIVKFKDSESSEKRLSGPGQGTLLAGIEYLVSSNDCAEGTVSDEDKFRYYDDLNLIELIVLSDKLVSYNFQHHIPSDLPVDHKFLPPATFNMQRYLDEICNWTDLNLMKLNEVKSN